MELPLVTIMIPAFNQEDFIERSINSALSQNYNNLEVVVADDCSTDRTGQIAQKFLHDSRFRYIKNDTNLGKQANYRHSLYFKAKGDWVINLDADDYLIDNEYISKAIFLINENPGMVVVFARLYFHYKDTDKKIPSLFFKRTRTVNNGVHFFFKILNPEAINHTTAIYNRKLAKEIDFYRLPYISCDWESLARLMLHGEVGFFNQFAAIWEIHGKNESMNMNVDGFLDNLKTYDSIQSYAGNLKIASKSKLWFWKFKMLYAYSFLIIGRFYLDRNIAKIKQYCLRLINSRPLIGLLLIFDLRLYLMLIIGNTKIELLLRRLFYFIKGSS